MSNHVNFDTTGINPDASIVVQPDVEGALVLLRRKRQKIRIKGIAVKIVESMAKGIPVYALADYVNKKYNVPLESFLKELEALIKIGAIETCLFADSRPGGLVRYVSTVPALDSIQLEVTRTCNLRCKHCYLEDYLAEDQLTTEEILDLIDEASEMGVINFDITGGEALLRRDLEVILRRVYEKGMISTLYTNGTLLDNSYVDFLASLPIERVQISIDGAFPETHDKIRGKPGSFQQALNAVAKLKEAGIPVAAGATANKVNIAEGKELIRLFTDTLKIPFHFDRFIPMGQGLRSEQDLVISDEEYVQTIVEEFRTLAADDPDPRSTDSSDEIGFYCGAGNSYVFITSRGAVKFCPTFPDHFSGGNIREHNLKEIWERGRVFTENRNVNCKYIRTCPHAKECKGGCRSRSLALYGGIDEPDLQMCKLYYELTGVKSPGLLSRTAKRLLDHR